MTRPRRAQRALLAALDQACADAASWPLPGGGKTIERWAALSELAARDLVLGRLVEAHVDALAILTELSAAPAVVGQRWGVWAAGPSSAVKAEPSREGWRLTGTKDWCSGATLLTHALVTATAEGEPRLFSVVLDDEAVHAEGSQWVGAGMGHSDTRSVTFQEARAEAVGGPDDYLQRSGFWVGAMAVAACWYGGATGVGRALVRKGRTSKDPHLLAHLGAVHANLSSSRATLRQAAVAVDERPTRDHRVLARAVRASVERSAAEVMDRVGRALGPGPLAHDAEHSGLVADLTVYVRQHHAERDLEALGRDLADATEDPSWWL